MNCQFPILDSFIDFILHKFESSRIFDIHGLINFGFEKTSYLVDDVLIKFKHDFFDDIKQELKYILIYIHLLDNNHIIIIY